MSLTFTTALEITKEESNKLWGLFLKNKTWADNAMSRKGSTPVPVLVSRDLLKIAQGKFDNTYVSLVFRGSKRRPEGHIPLEEFQLWRSLQPGPHADGEITLESGITLHVYGALESVLHDSPDLPENNRVKIKDPRRLFTQKGRKLKTYVLYYGENKILTINNDQIAKRKNRAIWSKKGVKAICAIPNKDVSGRQFQCIYANEDKFYGHVRNFRSGTSGWIESWSRG